MYPPSHVCRALYRLDPQIRLAWLGFKPQYAGHLNPGTFCIVQLWAKDHYGTFEKPNIPSELWNVQPYREQDGSYQSRRIDRGPVFSKNGDPTPDWDLNAYEMVYRMNLKDFGISTEDVLTGAILDKLERFYRPLKERIEESNRETIRMMKSRAEENGREAGMKLHRALNRHDVRYNIVPYEDQRKELQKLEEAKQRRDVTEMF